MSNIPQISLQQDNKLTRIFEIITGHTHQKARTDGSIFFCEKMLKMDCFFGFK